MAFGAANTMDEPYSMSRKPVPATSERRTIPRVDISLSGRYMLPDKSEFTCTTMNATPHGIEILCPVRGEVGQRIICYIDDIGRVEGEIARHTPVGMAFVIYATDHKRAKLASTIDWLSKRNFGAVTDSRRDARIAPKRKLVTVTTGTDQFIGSLVDVSLSGAAVRARIAPQVGAMVRLGDTDARVVRHDEGGFGVEFVRHLEPGRLTEMLEL